MSIVEFTQKIENHAAKSKFIYRIACLYYRDTIQKEIELANITSEDKILCIGGGNCPFSAIMFNQSTGANVTVIDKCASCAKNAEEVIKNLGLSESINVQALDGMDVDVKEYTVIHFAKQISPAKRVLNYIKSRAIVGTKLLVRTPNKRIGTTQLIEVA